MQRFKAKGAGTPMESRAWASGPARTALDRELWPDVGLPGSSRAEGRRPEQGARQEGGQTPAEERPQPASHDAGGLSFELPPELEAREPPEARGLTRDQVRLMVSYPATDSIVHTRFRDLGRFLAPGDLVVVNTSATLKAALSARRADGLALELHLSTHLPADLWIVEVRRPGGGASLPFREVEAGEQLALPAGGVATLHAPYLSDRSQPPPAPPRLWIATLQLPAPLLAYLDQHGFPIRYGYVERSWPIDYYQTVYADEPGSAEMPSAGRAFSSELLAELAERGVQIARLVLHTGVASLEDHEPPYEEFYRVPLATAALVNDAHQRGGRVVAVGTTVVRALESATDAEGVTHPAEGWTRLVITPDRRLRAVDALLTGLHEPQATHLAMLEALAGRDHVHRTYQQALAQRYLWHEFGDLHLIVGRRA